MSIGSQEQQPQIASSSEILAKKAITKARGTWKGNYFAESNFSPVNQLETVLKETDARVASAAKASSLTSQQTEEVRELVLLADIYNKAETASLNQEGAVSLDIPSGVDPVKWNLARLTDLWLSNTKEDGNNKVKKEFTLKEGSVLEQTVTRLGGTVQNGNCTFETSLPQLVEWVGTSYSASTSPMAKAA